MLVTGQAWNTREKVWHLRRLANVFNQLNKHMKNYCRNSNPSWRLYVSLMSREERQRMIFVFIREKKQHEMCAIHMKRYLHFIYIYMLAESKAMIHMRRVHNAVETRTTTWVNLLCVRPMVNDAIKAALLISSFSKMSFQGLLVH